VPLSLTTARRLERTRREFAEADASLGATGMPEARQLIERATHYVVTRRAHQDAIAAAEDELFGPPRPDRPDPTKVERADG
jgi:hypothetical protein